jgi:hypothetical protein
MTVLYEVKTGHTKEVLKAYTKIFLKMENWKMMFYFGTFAAVFFLFPRAFTVPAVCKWISWGVGALLILFAVVRPYLIYSNMMAKDKYFQNRTEITMSFGNSAFEVTDDEKRTYKYHTIKSLFMDDKMLYLEMEDRDLFIVPKQDFVQGTAEQFCDFMERTVEKRFEDFNERFKLRMKRRPTAAE